MGPHINPELSWKTVSAEPWTHLRSNTTAEWKSKIAVKVNKLYFAVTLSSRALSLSLSLRVHTRGSGGGSGLAPLSRAFWWILPAATLVAAQLPVVPPRARRNTRGPLKSGARQPGDVTSAGERPWSLRTPRGFSPHACPQTFFLLAVTRFLPAARMACVTGTSGWMCPPPPQEATLSTSA